MKVAVVGSGLAGIAAARALILRGFAVTLLDVGESLSPERSALVEKLKHRTLTGPIGSELEVFGQRVALKTGELPEKLHFGSDYIYATDRSFALTWATRAPYPTFARGGFSNIWGAAILPVAACDMADWPVSHAEMEPYFRAAAQMLPITDGEGTLSNAFPTYKDTVGAIDPGPQGRLLLRDLNKAQLALLSRNTLYGRARLAVYTEPDDGEVLACNNCGDCSLGCVRGAIFGIVPLLNRMIGHKEIDYRDNIFVETVSEENGVVTVNAIDVEASERISLTFDALFVAAGPINTTRLMLSSQKLYNRPIRLKESQKFVIPMLRRRAALTATEVPSITLSAAFIETKLPDVSDHWVHAQIVAMNRTISENARLPFVRTDIGNRFWSPLLRRVMGAWCGMHSDHSSHLSVTLSLSRGGVPDRLRIQGNISHEATIAAKKAARDLYWKGFLFDTIFCYWMMRMADPGRGTHCGSAFPMRNRPTREFDADRFGRPFGWSRIFAVDSTVLPSIPGTTIALTTMANAFRIGSEAPL